MKSLNQHSISTVNKSTKAMVRKFASLKRKLFLAIVLGLCIVNVQAQKVAMQSVGVKGGVNTFSISGTDTDGSKTLLGVHLGAFTIVPIQENLSFHPELIYSLNRWKGKDVSSDVHANWSYLDIPLLVKLQIDQITEGLSFHAGPQIGLLLAAKRKGTTSGGNEVNDDRSDFVKGSNFSLGFGAGYALPSGIQFTIRYLIGLSKVAQNPDGDVFDVKTGSFQVSAAYVIFKK